MRLDPELAEILRAEGSERLAKMEEALLRLEADTRDAEAVDELFRHAHSLKGAARMAELDELASRAHALEDHLASLRGGKPVEGEDASLVLAAIDAMRALLPGRAPSPAAPAAKPAAQDEGVRVSTADLDVIFNRVGELAVVRHRWERRRDDAMRLLDEWRALRPDARHDPIAAGLERLASDLDADRASLAATAGQLDETVQRVRLIAIDTALGPMRRVVRDVAAASGNRAAFEADGSETRLDKRVLDGVKDALMHLVRNAVDHGIETPAERAARGKPESGTVRVRAYQDGSDVIVEVEDDGRGFDVEKVRAAVVRKGLATPEEMHGASAERVLEHVFLPGFTTADKVTGVSGRGVGLDVVRDAARRLRGSYRLENRPGRGATVRLRLPATRSAARVLVVRLGGRAYAFPVESIVRIERVEAISPLELDALRAAPLAELLEVPAGAARPGILLDLAAGSARAGVLVEDVEGEHEIIVKPHSELLRGIRAVAGAAILGSGDVCIVLEPGELVASVRRAPERPRVLVVDDSAAMRAAVAEALQRAGYECAFAQDGLEALALAAGGGFSAVVSDVEMPRMDGLALVRRLRADPSLAQLPVVLVTGLSSEADRARGIEAGADAYVVKGKGAAKELLAQLQPRVAAARRA